MSFIGRQTGIRKTRSTRQTINKNERNRLKEYTGDTDSDDMAAIFVLDLLKNKKPELPLDYKFIVQMTILLYYNEDFLKTIEDDGIRNEMKELREKVDERFKNNITIMIDKFNEQLLEDERLEKYREYLTKDNLLRKLIDNVNSLIAITLKAKVASQFIEKGDLTLYSGLGWLNDCDKLMLENLLYLKKIKEKEWITPTFISTTHSRDTSIRFTGRIRKDSNKLDILRIIVPESKLEYFPYNPMYDRVIQFPMSRRETTHESEVLLPPYMKLEYLGEKEEVVKYLTPRIESIEPIINETSVVFHDLRFIDYADKFELKNKNMNEKKKIIRESKYDPLKISEELKDVFIKKTGGKKDKNKKVTKKKKREKKITRKYNNKRYKKKYKKNFSKNPKKIKSNF